MKKFSTRLIEWHHINGRKNLPWQKRKTPYRIWISEIMLQQTRVSTASLYFTKFIKKFPNVKKLAASNVDEILGCWSGLGYYARARNIHKAAEKIESEYGGRIPNSLDKLMNLPGIGKSTAGAILALGFKKKAAILDGNVKRVLSRHRKIDEDISLTSTSNKLWEVSINLVPDNLIDVYTQSIMDLGATICTKSNPSCNSCPVKEDCLALEEGLVKYLPLKRKSKPKDTKIVHWLIPLSPKGELLLQKRIDKGLWEGLWTFIESDKREILEQECLMRFKIENRNLHPLKTVKHSFSHYNLVAIPYVIEVKKSAIYKNTVWVNPINVESLGIPAPIKKTMQQVTTL